MLAEHADEHGVNVPLLGKVKYELTDKGTRVKVGHGSPKQATLWDEDVRRRPDTRRKVSEVIKWCRQFIDGNVGPIPERYPPPFFAWPGADVLPFVVMDEKFMERIWLEHRPSSGSSKQCSGNAPAGD